MHKLLFATLLLIGLQSCKKDDILLTENQKEQLQQLSSDDTISNSKKEQSEEVEKPILRPSDYEMGSRALAQWKVSESVYLKKLNFEDLTEHTEKITPEILKELVVFHSSSVDGKIQYDFTEADLADVTLKNVSYNVSEGILSFQISYKNVVSKGLSTLEFSPLKYFALHFDINKEYVSTHYMRGIYENISGFTGEVLRFEGDRYLPGDIVSKGKDELRNSMTFTFKVFDTVRNQNVIEITKDLSGFKTIESLAAELMISPTHELLETVKQTIKQLGGLQAKELNNRLQIKFSTQKWMQKMQYDLDSLPLTIAENGIYGSGYLLDVYLENPRWRLKSVEIKDNSMYLSIQLESVNGIVLNNTFYKVIVKGIK